MSEMSQAQQPAVNDSDPDPSADIVPPSGSDDAGQRSDDHTAASDVEDVEDDPSASTPDLQAVAHRTTGESGDADQSASDPMPNV